jgi:uncharacterized membrane protein (DUF2068 family)
VIDTEPPTTTTPERPSGSVPRVRPAAPHAHTTRGLELIGAFKIFEGIFLLGVALGAFGLLRPDWADQAQDWVERISLSETNRTLAAIAGSVLALFENGSSRFLAIGGGALLYATLFFVEGIALWKGKRWAEYLVLVSTAIPLPFELRAVWHHASLLHVSILAINVGIILYLAKQLARTPHHPAS